MTTLAKFLKDESGLTAIEYSMIGGLISILIVGAIASIDTSLNAHFQSVITALSP